MACPHGCGGKKKKIDVKVGTKSKASTKTVASTKTITTEGCIGLSTELHLLNIKCIRSYNRSRVGDESDKETSAIILAISKEIAGWIRNLRVDCPPEETLNEYKVVVELAYVKYVSPSSAAPEVVKEPVVESTEDIIIEVPAIVDSTIEENKDEHPVDK